MVSAKNKDGETFSIPTKQRALILQGGGALGYYEICVLQSIYNNIFKMQRKTDHQTKIIIILINFSFLILLPEYP